MICKSQPIVMRRHALLLQNGRRRICMSCTSGDVVVFLEADIGGLMKILSQSMFLSVLNANISKIYKMCSVFRKCFPH